MPIAAVWKCRVPECQYMVLATDEGETLAGKHLVTDHTMETFFQPILKGYKEPKPEESKK